MRGRGRGAGRWIDRVRRLVTDVPLRLKLATNSGYVAKVMPADLEVAERYASLLHEAHLTRL